MLLVCALVCCGSPLACFSLSLLVGVIGLLGWVWFVVVPGLACLSFGWCCGVIFLSLCWGWSLGLGWSLGRVLGWAEWYWSVCLLVGVTSAYRSIWVGHLCLVLGCADLCWVVCLFVGARLGLSVALFVLVAGCGFGFWWCWIVCFLICFRVLCGLSFSFFELCIEKITVHPFRVDFGRDYFEWSHSFPAHSV